MLVDHQGLALAVSLPPVCLSFLISHSIVFSIFSAHLQNKGEVRELCCRACSGFVTNNRSPNITRADLVPATVELN